MERDAWWRWLHAYEDAWRSPGTERLAALFTQEATYRTAPFQPFHRGLPAIARLWEAEREGADEVFTLATEIVAVEGDTGVARAEVRYGDPLRQLYLDLWIITLDAGGRCSAFEEWPCWPPD